MLSRAIAAAKDEAGATAQHATESLRARGRELARQLGETDDAVAALNWVIQEDRRHLKELRVLSTKFRRMASARAVLNKVEFSSCPRCAKPLPSRPDDICRVCGQPDAVQPSESEQLGTTDVDIGSRSGEIEDTLQRRESQLTVYRRDADALSVEKEKIEHQLDEASRSYDSAYLSRSLALEQERAPCRRNGVTGTTPGISRKGRGTVARSERYIRP